MISDEQIFNQVVNTINSYDDIMTDADLEFIEAFTNICNDKWVTIRGNHILIKDGETLADAFKRITGKSLNKENKYKPSTKHKSSEAYSKILQSVKESNNKKFTADEIIQRASKTFKTSPEEISAKIKEAQNYADAIRKYGLETFNRHSKNHSYKEEREALHKEIIDKIFANKEKAKPKNGEKPKAVFLGGRGGSGKSKFGMPDKDNPANLGLYNKENYIVLDADAIKEQLPEYQGFNAYEVHEESSDILNKAIQMARDEGLNVVLDATMKTLSSSERKIKSFADADYDIEMYYMHLPREKAAERAIGRYMDRGTYNGRYVPLNEILDNMKHNEENFDILKKYATKWAFYNNDVPTKDDSPILIDKNF